jgi:hypothetical protein
MSEENDDKGPEPTSPTTPPSTGSNGDPWADPEAARAEIEKLRKENAGHRVKVRELEPLAKKAQEAAEAQKTEIERATERAAAAEARALEAELGAMRIEVAARHGLTPAQAKRLQGGNEAELEADASEFAKEIQVNGSKPKADLKQGDRGQAPAADAETWLRQMVGRKA